MSRAGRVHRGAAVALALLLPAAFANSASAQSRAPVATQFGPGGELENYLRLLQISGIVESYPWSLRGFSARELRRILPADSAAAGLPWTLGRGQLARGFAVGPVGVKGVANSAFPYGGNDGAVWAGKGLTLTGSASITARLGALSVALAPIAFITTNGAFPLLDNGQADALAFNDGRFPLTVDRPQRFGAGAYGRGDPGASEIRVDTRFLTVGFGTAPMSWGPASEYPFLIGTNAPGFPHLFIGSGEPLNVLIGRLHTRAVWGRLAQSAHSPVTGSERFLSESEPGQARLMAGMLLVFSPSIAPSLELGFARFLHTPYPADGVDAGFLRRAWPRFLKKNVYGPAETRQTDVENELASVFARWAFPSVGFELYAEHGQDDWYHDLRDLTQEPEHNRSYMIGFQKVMTKSPQRLSAVRAELINHVMPPLGRDRPGQGLIYTHNVLRQGHTHRGQLIGANTGAGAASASTVAWDQYTPRGRTSVYWRRHVRAHRGEFFLGGTTDEKAIDVIHALGIERSRGSSRLRYTLGVDLMANFNRNFSSDVFNLNARAGLEWSPSAAPAGR